MLVTPQNCTRCLEIYHCCTICNFCIRPNKEGEQQKKVCFFEQLLFQKLTFDLFLKHFLRNYRNFLGRNVEQLVESLRYRPMWGINSLSFILSWDDEDDDDDDSMHGFLLQHLPKGAAFVKTSKGSIILTFRLSSEQAANELWNMYTERKFQSMVQTVFVEDALKDSHKDGLEKTPKLELSLCVERFNKIREKLRGRLSICEICRFAHSY